MRRFVERTFLNPCDLFGKAQPFRPIAIARTTPQIAACTIRLFSSYAAGALSLGASIKFDECSKIGFDILSGCTHCRIAMVRTIVVSEELHWHHRVAGHVKH